MGGPASAPDLYMCLCTFLFLLIRSNITTCYTTAINTMVTDLYVTVLLFLELENV